MKELNLSIKGMMCTGCENRVKNALENIEGIEEANADHVSGIVNVVCEENITMQKVEEIINDLGFEIVE